MSLSSIDELIGILRERGLEDSLYLPEEFTVKAIIGISSYGNVIYDRYKLAHCYAVDYAEHDGFDYEQLDDEKKGEYEQDAMEHIDYNILSAMNCSRTLGRSSGGSYLPLLIMDPIEDFL